MPNTYARDFPIRKWLIGLDDELWVQLPLYHQRLLAQRYGLEDRGEALGLSIERMMGLREMALLWHCAHQNLAATINRTLGFLMRQIMLAAAEKSAGVIFPPELLDQVFPSSLPDRPVDEAG